MSGRQFYVEMGGAGVLFSANFDSRFVAGNSLGFGFRIGAGFGTGRTASSDGDIRSYMTFPVGLNYVFGKSTSPHTFEVGAGATFIAQKVELYSYHFRRDYGNVIGHFSFMYRRQPIDGGFTWRIGFTPIIGTSGDIIPSGAVGVGYSF